MADELTEISRTGKAVTVKVDGCAMFTNFLDKSVAELAVATGGAASTQRCRPDADKPRVILTITINDTTINRKKYREVVRAWFTKKHQEFAAMGWELSRQARRSSAPKVGGAMAVHSTLH